MHSIQQADHGYAMLLTSAASTYDNYVVEASKAIKDSD